MKILVWGGDGFCGWPTSLHLSALGNEILIVDNLSRRKIDAELKVDSLTPITSISERLRAWEEVGRKAIAFAAIDAAKDYAGVLRIIKEFAPDAMVHFAEQRSAPFSMKSSATKLYTMENNTAATANILTAMVESGRDIHMVHLGTMGVYGYNGSSLPIPEGYLDVLIPNGTNSPESRQILYPTAPGSIYHMTKCLDQLMFAYYAQNDRLRITDLHQGIVWGTQTPQTICDERLINRFDYDGDYGTVLNRFLVQAAIGHPLTVHGSGGQTRALIHIKDTVRCVELAIQHPPAAGDRVKILNQLTETKSVLELAHSVSQLTGAKVVHLHNPRNEAEKNELHAENTCFIKMGLEPTFLSLGLMDEVKKIAERYKGRCNIECISCTSYWNKERASLKNG